jgi:hypothetical protein
MRRAHARQTRVAKPCTHLDCSCAVLPDWLVVVCSCLRSHSTSANSSCRSRSNVCRGPCHCCCCYANAHCLSLRSASHSAPSTSISFALLSPCSVSLSPPSYKHCTSPLPLYIPPALLPAYPNNRPTPLSGTTLLRLLLQRTCGPATTLLLPACQRLRVDPHPAQSLPPRCVNRRARLARSPARNPAR